MTGIAAGVAGVTVSAEVGATGSGARERALPASQANKARGIIKVARAGDILKRTQGMRYARRWPTARAAWSLTRLGSTKSRQDALLSFRNGNKARAAEKSIITVVTSNAFALGRRPSSDNETLVRPTIGALCIYCVDHASWALISSPLEKDNRGCSYSSRMFSLDDVACLSTRA